MNNILPAALAAVLLAGCSHLPNRDVDYQGGSHDYYPLHKGSSWKYSVDAEWAAGNGKIKSRENITEIVTVVDTFRAGNILAARLRETASEPYGWSNKKTSEYLIVKVGTNHYYRTEYGKELWNKIVASEGDSYLEELDRMDLLLETPLQDGALFGDPAETPRGEYCQKVIGFAPFDTAQIKGAPQLRDAQEFTIMYRGRPEHSLTYFVPGLGFTGYEYEHHGTRLDISRRLVEYQPNATAPAPSKQVSRKNSR